LPQGIRGSEGPAADQTPRCGSFSLRKNRQSSVSHRRPRCQCGSAFVLSRQNRLRCGRSRSSAFFAFINVKPDKPYHWTIRPLLVAPAAHREHGAKRYSPSRRPTQAVHTLVRSFRSELRDRKGLSGFLESRPDARMPSQPPTLKNPPIACRCSPKRPLTDMGSVSPIRAPADPEGGFGNRIDDLAQLVFASPAMLASCALELFNIQVHPDPLQ